MKTPREYLSGAHPLVMHGRIVEDVCTALQIIHEEQGGCELDNGGALLSPEENTPHMLPRAEKDPKSRLLYALFDGEGEIAVVFDITDGVMREHTENHAGNIERYPIYHINSLRQRETK